MQNIDDDIALKLMRAGHEIGLEILYKLYFPKLRYKVLKLISKYANHDVSRQKDEIADEICQEVFYNFYNKIDIFQEKCSVMTWLSNLAYNKTIDYLKKEGKGHPNRWSYEKITPKDLQKEPIFSESLEDEQKKTFFRIEIENYEQEEKIFCYAQCIDKALTKIDVNSLECLKVLIFSLQKLSIIDIAKKMSISDKKAKSILNDCKDNIKKNPNCMLILMLFYEFGLSQKDLVNILEKEPQDIGNLITSCRNMLRNNIDLKDCYEKCKDT
ncbi:RNA polymerase sigma factor [Thiotrichales bacterium HSG1]|nr:RNA polymerase sigma factor [Thiotrichales bacterium HSG1]